MLYHIYHPLDANYRYHPLDRMLSIIYLFYILNCKLSLDLQNVRPSVPLYLLQFLSDSFNIAHRASLQCRGRHGRNFFFFRVIFGPFSAIFKAKKGLKLKIRWILSISHTWHCYNIASIIKEKKLWSGHLRAVFRHF